MPGKAFAKTGTGCLVCLWRPGTRPGRRLGDPPACCCCPLDPAASPGLAPDEAVAVGGQRDHGVEPGRAGLAQFGDGVVAGRQLAHDG
jgi:hypothetical protein